MRWTEWLLCWFKPSHWRDNHPFKAAERPEANAAGGPDRQTTTSSGAESSEQITRKQS